MILVTGSLGFIGHHLVGTLISKGKTVIGLDDWSRGKSFINDANYHLVSDRVQNIDDALSDIGDDISCIVHLAAFGSVPKSFENPKKYWANNTGGMLSVLEFARKFSIPVVWASSSSVYGDITELPRIEANLGKAMSPYALTKQSCEHLADLYIEKHKMKITGLRFFNVYGPNQNPEYGAVIPSWITSAIDGKQIIVNGSKGILRDYTYVSDIVDGIILAIQQQVNGNFNLGYGVGVTLGDLLEEISKYKQVESRVGQYRPGDVLASVASIEKARGYLGYRPKVNIQEGIKRTWDYYASKRNKRITN